MKSADKNAIQLVVHRARSILMQYLLASVRGAGADCHSQQKYSVIYYFRSTNNDFPNMASRQLYHLNLVLPRETNKFILIA